eukprot:gb/GEZN01006999.1/.p1 GENE.gb/GEZN01006999.1/~~gb/GEZN01006999.1/.p1  ORF type:complete len:409 (-),score=68.71 gb/GEZN01006999.1/:281-1507(-)
MATKRNSDQQMEGPTRIKSAASQQNYPKPLVQASPAKQFPRFVNDINKKSVPVVTKGFGPSSGKREDMAKEKLLGMYEGIRDELLAHCKPHLPAEGLSRIKEMLEYTILGGKMYRGMLVVNTVAVSLQHADVQKMQQAMIVAWCIEILQAAFLVADDIMDRSITRRGKPCWYRHINREGEAINDSLLLESFVYILLKKHFRKASAPLYMELTDLFREVTYLTELGQMLDINCETSPDISFFTQENYNKICYNKTAMYTFYLPVLSGLHIAFDGEVPEQTVQLCDKICSSLGLKFQIQDDFLDCFGDQKTMGKIGTDIRDHKCTWLLLQALGLASPGQLQMLKDSYGKHDEEAVAKISALYRTLGLQRLYEQEEERSFQMIQQQIESASGVIPPAVFLPVLYKMHGRPK